MTTCNLIPTFHIRPLAFPATPMATHDATRDPISQMSLPDNASEIAQPFDPMELSISTKTTTVELVMSRLARQEIDLNPDFRRNAGIWDRTTRSRLIESLLLRIPLPLFHVAADSNDHWHVVDGIQRLCSMKSFVLDKTLKLHGLEYFTQFERFSYDDLPRRMQRRIDETELAFHVVDARTPDTVMFNVFKRLSTGGRLLTPQEIRLRSSQVQRP